MTKPPQRLSSAPLASERQASERQASSRAPRSLGPLRHSSWMVASLCGLSASSALSTGCALVPGHAARTSVRPASADDRQEPRELLMVRHPAAVKPLALGAGTLGSGLRFDPPIALVSEEDAIVRLVLPTATCTGTLIDDDLVLTAHHCVVERSADGGFSSTVLPAGKIDVELGGDYLAWGRVKTRAVIVPPCGETGGGGDLAILVLERKLVGVPTKKPRLTEPPRIGEVLDSIGFGRCATSLGIKRHLRAGGPVRSLSGETIHMSAAVCPGDSGGPVVTRGTGEVVGVVSLSAMDGDEHTQAASVMARLDSYRNVFSQARLVADGFAQNELPPLSCR